MTRTASRLVTLAVALVALFAVAAAPATAKASESALRERTHARIAAVLSDAVNSGIYSTAQENYVTSALLPTYVDPKGLSSKVEERTIEAFWGIVADGAGLVRRFEVTTTKPVVLPLDEATTCATGSVVKDATRQLMLTPAEAKSFTLNVRLP